MLKVEGLEAGYGGLTILQGLTLEVREGEVVALIGANGAGKTTALNTISGIVARTAGTIEFQGERIDTLPEHQIVRRGIVQVPEGRELFGSLTVAENLRMGATTLPRGQYAETLAEVHEIFPVLADRSNQYASTMSGGQQQMLAIGRALMARPKLLMMDEPSLGLAPKLVLQVFETVERVRSAGITVLIVEQNAARTLEIADRAYVLESGEVALSGSGRELLADERVQRAYLGM
jgi:branched-chain amino acid transport system ATP-binding protein